MSDDFRTDPFDPQPPPIPDDRQREYPYDDRRSDYPYDDRRSDYPYDDRPPGRSRPSAPLPSWLARKHLHPDEQVLYVGGPRFNPSLERYITHPLLFVAALALGAVCAGFGWTMERQHPGTLAVGVLAAFGLFIGSIIVLGLCCGYFTRLVATNRRVLILQGYEVCRRWHVHELPRHMVRYGRLEDGRDGAPTIDLNAMKTMLGGSSDQFVDAKTIMAFGKQINRMRGRDDDRR